MGMTIPIPTPITTITKDQRVDHRPLWAPSTGSEQIGIGPPTEPCRRPPEANRPAGKPMVTVSLTGRGEGPVDLPEDGGDPPPQEGGHTTEVSLATPCGI